MNGNQAQPGRGLTRRELLGSGALLGMSAFAGSSLLAACSSDSSSSGKLTQAAYSDGTHGTVRYLCWEQFADKSFTGDFNSQVGAVKPTYYGSFDEMFGKLRAGGGSSYDACTTASDIIQPLADADELAPIDVASLPNYGKLRQQLQTSDLWNVGGSQYAIPLDWGSTVILVNTKTVGEQSDVLPFDMLFDPKFRGRAACMDDLSVLYTMGVYRGVEKFWDMSDDELADLQSFLVENFLPNVRKFAVTFADEANLFANGEVDIAWGWTGVIRAELLRIDADYVTEHVIQPAMPWYVDTISPIAGSDNLDAVAAWINYNLDPKVAAQRFTVTGLPCVVPDAAQYLTTSQQQQSYLTAAQESFWTELDQNLQWQPVPRRSLYQQVWNSVKSGIKEFSPS
jgi:spermidine/putrescine transport system substrate-binding protein